MECPTGTPVDLARDALVKDRARVRYRPIVNVRTGELAGIETDPGDGVAGPDQSLRTIEVAFDDLTSWTEQSEDRLRLAIHASGALLEAALFEKDIFELLVSHRLSATQIELVLDHASLSGMSPTAAAGLRQLRNHGVTVCVHSVGSCRLSIQELAELPADAVRIDPSFVQDAVGLKSAAVTCKTIIELARSMGVRSIAEGVATPGQWALVRQLGYAEALGPFVGEAASVEDILAMTRSGVESCKAATSNALTRRHLLLVDDEANVLHALQRTLRCAGMTIHATTQPVQAFELLARYPIGVVISDQRMPDMTGSEFLGRVRDLYPATRRIVLSGYTELQSITDAINRGAISKFLTKPWSDVELQQALQDAFHEFELAAENLRLQGELGVANHRLEQALQSQVAKTYQRQSVLNALHMAVGALPVPVLGIDEAGDLALINAAAEQLFADAEPMLGEPVRPWLGLELGPAAPVVERFERGDRRFVLHAQPLGGPQAGHGLMVTLLPEPA